MDPLDLFRSQVRAEWAPAFSTCVTNVHTTKLNIISILTTDIVLLLTMLIGLLRLGFHESGVYGLGKLMWKQVGSAHLASRGACSAVH